MHIKFVCFGFENIGVEYLSACLKKSGHKVSLAFDPLLFKTYLFKIRTVDRFFDYKKILIDEILNDDIDLLAFSVMSDNYKRACEIAMEVKALRQELPIIFGGVHPTSVPEQVINEPFVDFICVGEGEEAIVDLVNAIERKEDVFAIPNIWGRRNKQVYANPVRALINDLDTLPFPDKEIFQKEFSGFNRSVYRINVGRGCLLDCSFCINGLMRNIYKDSGYKKRKRSVSSVISELKSAKKKYNFKHVLIIDDWFTDDINWLEDFCGEYKKEIGLSFACDLYPGIDNKKVIPLLERAGCSVVSFGIQTHSERLRRSILNRYDSNLEIANTLQLLKRTKIFTYADFIIGIPGQDEEELLKIANFININRVDFIFFLWLRYYPNTPITQMAIENGWIEDVRLKNNFNDLKNISYFDKGENYSVQAAQLAGFLNSALFLPKNLTKFMIKNKFYRIFPGSSFFYFRIMSLFIVFVKKILQNKSGIFYFFPQENFKTYAFYLSRAINHRRKVPLFH